MKYLILALALALALTSCGGKKEGGNASDTNKATNEATNKPDSEFDNQALVTGPGKASRTVKFWDVEYQLSNGLDLNGKWQGTVSDVKGVVYVGGQIAYSFQSKSTFIPSASDRLYISGLITLTAENGAPQITKTDSERITWLPESSKFVPGWPNRPESRGFRDDSTPGRLSRSKHLWDIEWQSANLFIKQIDLQGKKSSKQFGTMKGVKGVVYDNGQIASTFSAELAEAFEADDRLKLSGKVVLTAIEIDKKDNSKKTTVLKANDVTWDPVQKRYVASGAVEVDGPSGYLAPTDKVFATSNLDKIATSEDYFKK